MKAIIAALALLASLLPGPALASDMTADDGGGAGAWPSDDRMFVTGVSLTDYPGNMANGWPSHVGAAACPRWMPLGMELLIERIGHVTCEDLYRRDLTDRVDVYVPTRADAFRLTGCYHWRPVTILTVPSEAWYAARPSIPGNECGS